MKKLKVIKPSRFLSQEEQISVSGGLCLGQVELYVFCKEFSTQPCYSYNICDVTYRVCTPDVEGYAYCPVPYTWKG